MAGKDEEAQPPFSSPISAISNRRCSVHGRGMGCWLAGDDETQIIMTGASTYRKYAQHMAYVCVVIMGDSIIRVVVRRQYRLKTID